MPGLLNENECKAVLKNLSWLQVLRLRIPSMKNYFLNVGQNFFNTGLPEDLRVQTCGCV